MRTVVEAFELFTAGLTVASTGALLAIVYIVFSPTLDSEVKNNSHERPL